MVHLPDPFRDIPRTQLLFPHPSHIERLDRLAAVLPSPASVWIKRDDCNSGLAFGGNKVRKLEYVLADALAQGADTLLTTGGVQSNHMRQTAAAAARLGLKTALCPRDAFPVEDKEYAYAGNVQLNSILGAETFPAGVSLDTAAEELKKRGRKPYLIPSGASTHPFGGLGYARWAFELLEQESALGVTFDVVVTTVGSGSTLGGMVAGFKLAEKTGLLPAKKRLLGFSVINPSHSPDGESKQVELVLGIARATAAKIGLREEDITQDDFEINSRFAGPAYGVLDDQTVEGVKELARTEGILLDPVYTGKTFTGLLHVAREGGFAGANVLFCHTGGQVALSAYPGLL
ncbi:1-aminocyclopropane-1-carboxylate deaminase [Stachybotrys elegans]|uniref:1-aminocyclopropane-1-carboxylate deaminase n=1 Tax=Stachybotrys elegans TaxID=80388 RepID=A0A8K0SS53_9HYPO|nr:1-aminocyclopropane-1-carboxylate deaminase [Stachybotrys elegans]